MISIPAISLIILQNPVSQTLLSRYVSGKLAAVLNTNISIDKVSITFINRVQLKNLYIEDQHGDTLFFADKLNATIRRLDRDNQVLKIKRLIIKNADINFITDTEGVINLKFIIDFLKKSENKTSDKVPWKIEFSNIDLKNSRFRLAKEQINEVPAGINFTDMDMNDMNLNIDDLIIIGDSISMFIKDLNLFEKSGFIINRFSSNLVITKNQMYFDDVLISTPYSEIEANYTHLDFDDFKDFSDVINLVNIKLLFEPSKISFSDISYFAPALTGYKENFRIKGQCGGKINEIKGDKVLLYYNDNTLLETNFNIIGLPDFKNTFLHFDISRLITTTENIELLELPGKTKHINLPQNLRKLGKIHYSGKFTGYPDDFVAYGKFETNLGDIYSDLLFKPDTLNTLRFAGRVKTLDFRMGELLSIEEKMGKISMSGNVDGYTTSGSLYARIESIIDSFEIYRYNYENIVVSGTLTEKNFSGSFAVVDPNINMEFKGRADFSGDNPEYHFEAEVLRSRPYYLNIEKSDPSYFASFLLRTNFSGNIIDEINGEISLVNSFFKSSDQEFQIKDFSLKAYNYQEGKDSLIIRSDIIDAEINGSYKFSNLPAAFNKFINYYIPALSQDKIPALLTDNKDDFSYNIRLKNIHPFMKFFSNKYDIGNNSSFYGNFNSDNNQFIIHGTSPYITVNNVSLRDISINAGGEDEFYSLDISGAVMRFKNSEIENVDFRSEIYADTAKIYLNWDNFLKPRYEGDLQLFLVFDINDSSKNNRINILTKPSEFHYNDALWTMGESRLSVEKKYFNVENFKLQSETQDLYVNGTISEHPGDILNAKFSELDLSALNVFTGKHKIELEGLLSGEAALSDLLNKAIFLSDITVKDLIVNREFLGTGHLTGYWNNEFKKIEILAETINDNNKQLQIRGDYYPETEKLDFKIDIDKLKINLFEPFLSELISDLEGTGSGELTLGGRLSEPDLNGRMNFQKTSFVVNYLLTRYNFSNDVSLLHNNVIFNNFEIFDEKGSKAVAQGTIITNNLKSINLDLRLTANNFMFLNTSEKDNELFYGRVNASGLIRFSGPSDNMLMDITASTERNSVFFLPLYGAEEIYEYDFIQWISQEQKSREDKNKTGGAEYEVKLKGLKMNFNLEVTQDAEVQLIFDPKVGDILRGRGNGNIKMEISSLGKFEIFGDIIIDRGDYLFTLKNLINKYFQVEQGGRITWNGDPLDANIDLKAVYKLKASLYALAPEPMESLRKRIPVETQILMTGKLMNPTITPGINLPTADQQTRNILNNSITTDQELMNQFISLLVINNFYSEVNPTGIGGAAQRGSGVATSELFSNQLSRWLSQLSKDFDIGLNYRIGDEITTDQLEVALSTQILNDRVSISGNFGVGGQMHNPSQTMANPNNIAGDFDIDFRLTESGKIHLKAFNRTNYNFLFNSPYTQGVGITFRENFNTLGELMKRYKDAVLSIFSKEKRKKRKDSHVIDNDEEEDEEEENNENYYFLQ